MTISTRKALRAKQVETEDPLVAKLAETGAEDPEYIDMIKAVQDDNFNIPKENEIKKIKDHKSCLSIVTLESGHKLIIRKFTLFKPKYILPLPNGMVAHTL